MCRIKNNYIILDARIRYIKKNYICARDLATFWDRGLRMQPRRRAHLDTWLSHEFVRFYTNSPLAYLEWYNLQSYIPSLRMYQVTHSYRNRSRHASIIPVNQIVQSCHLIPKFGTKIGRTWKAENVLDTADAFYLNPNLRLHDFVLFR